ncbi:MAG: hypothetical protein M1113_00520 [Candidatus Thermoplasmatota archaeon]|nr:hypothetical protein [Candidatus Thermoplasmatota archaeon]
MGLRQWLWKDKEMFRPAKRRISRIAAVIIVLSVLLFGLSIYSIEHGVRTYHDVKIPSGSGGSVMFRENNVSAGNDIEYSVSGANSSLINVTAYLVAPNGDKMIPVSSDNGTSLSQVIVAGYSGNWTLVLLNNAKSVATVDVTITNIPYVWLLGAIFGFILLILGIILLAISSYTKYMERRREKNRGFSQ